MNNDPETQKFDKAACDALRALDSDGASEPAAASDFARLLGQYALDAICERALDRERTVPFFVGVRRMRLRITGLDGPVRIRRDREEQIRKVANLDTGRTVASNRPWQVAAKLAKFSSLSARPADTLDDQHISGVPTPADDASAPSDVLLPFQAGVQSDDRQADHPDELLIGLRLMGPADALEAQLLFFDTDELHPINCLVDAGARIPGRASQRHYLGLLRRGAPLRVAVEPVQGRDIRRRSFELVLEEGDEPK